MENITYSIVIPAYNEGARLGATLEKVLTYLRQQEWDAEVIVVNDGSCDDTAEIVRSFRQKNPAVRLLENPGNRGKGYSVRSGMLKARGDIVVFSDADLSSPVEEMPKLLAGGSGRGGHRHRFTLAAFGIANPASVTASAAFWKSLQSAAAGYSGGAIQRYAMRFQSVH